MAAANPVRTLQEEATCSICLEYYKDPVTTKCGHNFCRSCISGCLQGSDSGLTCPQCRDVCPQGDLRPNRQLQSIVELVKQLSLQPERVSLQPERAPGESLCEEHEEELKHFCEEDGKLICVICRESSSHRSHSVYPAEEVAVKNKGKLQEWLLPLRKEKDGLLASKAREEEDAKTMRDKLGTEKQKTVAEFQRMRQLLMEKEGAILGRLEEMELKITTTEKANIDKLSQQISSLSALITEIERKCAQPGEQLVEDVGSTLSRCEHVKTVNEFLGPEKHQPKFGSMLHFQGFADLLKQYKVHVTLDPDTVHRNLVLSDEGRRVAERRKKDNPGRFTMEPCVLGREGYRSGKHYWEVQLPQEGGGWRVGVALESVTQELGRHIVPKGVWAVKGWNGQYQACTNPPFPLYPRQHPMKLKVFLNFVQEEIRLSNADTMEHLYTFKHPKFTGRVYPYFRVWGGAELSLV